jgi:hypothetical protein
LASQNFRVKNGLEVGTGITISPNGNINSSGISTFNGVVIGGATTSLLVQGNARIIGILSVGQGTITFDGDNNQITVGSGITLSHTNGIYVGSSNITSTGLSISNINASGIVTAASFNGSITGTASTASFATTSFGLAGSPNITVGNINSSGVVTASSFNGNASSATFATNAGIATYATNAGIATFATNATNATNAQGLTGTPNITVGVATASTLNVGTSGTVITTTTAGLVGIGTTNPTSKLTVSGDVNITGITTHLDKISIRTSLISNEYASLSNSGKLVLGDGTSTSSGIDIVNNTTSPSAEIFTISTPSVNVYGKKIVVDYGGRLLLGGNLTSSLNSALTVLDNSGNITLSGYVSAAGTIGASGLTAGTVQISSGIVTATSGIVTYYGDASNTVSGRWILGADASSNYTFTGIGFTQTTNDPTLYLKRGEVYQFVNTMGAHPFRIQSTVNGSTGTQYNDGVTNNDVSNGTLTWIVPYNSPDYLYYQCTAHAGMGGEIHILGVRGIPQNSQVGAYILSISDSGKHISITTGGATVNSGIFSAGDTIAIYNNSVSNQTITQGSGVTLRFAGTSNTGNRTLAQYGLCTVLCVSANTFVISGSGLT